MCGSLPDFPPSPTRSLTPANLKHASFPFPSSFLPSDVLSPPPSRRSPARSRSLSSHPSFLRGPDFISAQSTFFPFFPSIFFFLVSKKALKGGLLVPPHVFFFRAILAGKYLIFFFFLSFSPPPPPFGAHWRYFFPSFSFPACGSIRRRSFSPLLLTAFPRFLISVFIWSLIGREEFCSFFLLFILPFFPGHQTSPLAGFPFSPPVFPRNCTFSFPSVGPFHFRRTQSLLHTSFFPPPVTRVFNEMIALFFPPYLLFFSPWHDSCVPSVFFLRHWIVCFFPLTRPARRPAAWFFFFHNLDFLEEPRTDIFPLSSGLSFPKGFPIYPPPPRPCPPKGNPFLFFPLFFFPSRSTATPFFHVPGWFAMESIMPLPPLFYRPPCKTCQATGLFFPFPSFFHLSEIRKGIPSPFPITPGFFFPVPRQAPSPPSLAPPNAIRR